MQLNLQSDFNVMLILTLSSPSPTCAARGPLGFNCLTAIYYYDSDHLRQRRNLGRIHEAHGAPTQFDTAIERGRRL